MVSKRGKTQLKSDVTSFFGAFSLNFSKSDFFDFGVGNIYCPDMHSEIFKLIGKKSLQNALTKSNSYPGTQGHYELNCKIVELIKKQTGQNFDPEEIVLSTGASDSISQALFTFLDKGEEVSFTLPSFPYWAIADSVEVKSNPVLNFDLFEPKISNVLIKKIKNSNNLKAFILNMPNSPMGYTLNKKELKKINNLSVEKDLKIIIDDVYGFFLKKKESPLNFVKNNSVIVNSFSKSFGLPGLRIGFTVLNKDEIGFFRACTANKYIGVSAFSTEIANELLDLLISNDISKTIKKEILTRKKELFKFKGKLKRKGLEFSKNARGSYYPLIINRNIFSSKLSEEKIALKLRENGVKVLHQGFFHPPNFKAEKKFLRISVSGENRVKEGMQKFLETIDLLQ